MFDSGILEVLFASHSNPQNENRHRVIREAGLNLAQVIVSNAPSSADASSAIRHVRNAVMEANAAIACEVPLLEVEEAILNTEEKAAEPEATTEAEDPTIQTGDEE